jgi:hypothetical protein
MAVTIRGTAILKWGTFTLTGYIVTDEELALEVGSFQIEDELGDIVTDITDFGKSTEATYNFIPLSAATQPEPGAVLTGPNSLKVIVRSVRRIRARKMPEMWRLTGQAYPAISL